MADTETNAAPRERTQIGRFLVDCGFRGVRDSIRTALTTGIPDIPQQRGDPQVVIPPVAVTV